MPLIILSCKEWLEGLPDAGCEELKMNARTNNNGLKKIFNICPIPFIPEEHPDTPIHNSLVLIKMEPICLLMIIERHIKDKPFVADWSRGKR